MTVPSQSWRRKIFLPEPRTAGGRKNPNQVQCRTLVGIIRKTKLSGYMKRKDPPSRAGLSFHGIRQRPTLPGRLQPSTIGAERLNFCVRYGNRWIPFAIVTGNRIGFFAYPENRTSRLLTSRITSFQFSLWSQLNSFRSSPRPISIIKLQMLPLFHR